MGSSNRAGLTGNQLKLIALITMTVDHVGMILLPRCMLLRIIGRIAFPIYAYMVAEGCTYTRHRGRYLAGMAGLALLCQLVYFFAMGSLYMSVLVTFSLSISLIYIADYVKSGGRNGYFMLWGAVFGIFFLATGLPLLLPGTDYGIDYGLWGILLPVTVYFGKDKKEKLRNFAICQVLLALSSGSLQWFSLASVLPLALYSGQRGKYKMKYLFYIYYPLHLVVLHGLSLLV